MSTLHAPASVFPFQTPARVISDAFEPSAGCTTFAPNAPDEHLDAPTVAEMNAWHDEHDAIPTPEEVDRMAAELRGVELSPFGWVDDNVPAALDDQSLINLLAAADEGDPTGVLAGRGIKADALPDYAAACAAELVRRLYGPNPPAFRLAA